jgi:SAM-dependent MidA family methyltransferase
MLRAGVHHARLGHQPAKETMPLPAPDAVALAQSAALIRHISSAIAQAGGWIGFNRFMELALYTPGLGYYSGGAHKFGEAGDFVTAPGLTSSFGQTLAAQARQILTLSAPAIIEVGAGSGSLAADLLSELELQTALPDSYGILELSGELRARQQETLARRVPHLSHRVYWLERLPEHFDGLVVANELLDAMPVHLVLWRDGERCEEILERGVSVDGEGEFSWIDRPASGLLLQRARELATECKIPVGYLSEVNLAAPAWAAEWARVLGRGALLLVDYGFPQHEYYHPQRDAGTLMCHYRHHSHAEPFYLPGLQDITAHVDFTAIAAAGCAAGLDFLGFTTQCSFLLNCGLPEVLARTPCDNALRYLPLAQAAQKLISPAEMGELFKVIALGKGIDETLLGFSRGDRSATL